MNRLYIIIVLWVMSLCVVGQETADSTVVTSETNIKKEKIKTFKFPHLYWGFSVGAGQFGLMNDDSNMNIENDLSYSGGIYFELQIKKWISAEVGGYYTMISGTASMDNYQTSFENKDDMGIDYSHIITAKDVVEEMEAGLLEIPISIKLLWNPGNWNFYLKPGVSYTMVMSSSYDQIANVGISGYYPENNITYDDLPQHGYFKSSYFKSSDELALKNSINPFIGAGVIMAGKGKSGVFFIEGKYYPGSIDFSNGEGNGTLFEGPMDNKSIGNYDFESLTEEGKVSLGGFIVQLGFRF